MTHESPKRDKFTVALIEQQAEGKGTLADAYFKAGYRAHSRRVAKANASRLKRHPEVQDRLKTFKDILNERAVPEAIADRLTEIIFSGDARASLEAMEKWIKINDVYPAHKLKFQASIEERDRLLE